MGPSGRLSDGGPELRGGTLAARQENGTRPAAAAAKIARNISAGTAARLTRRVRDLIRTRPHPEEPALVGVSKDEAIGVEIALAAAGPAVRRQRPAPRGHRRESGRPWRAGRWS